MAMCCRRAHNMRVPPTDCRLPIFIDITPNGRSETINGNLTDWVPHHDRYGEAAEACCHAKG